MKRKFVQAAILSLLTFSFVGNIQAQSGSGEVSATKQLLDARRYEFLAQTMSPMSGRIRQLTGYYSMIVTPDTVSADLPYMGKAYSAPMDPANTGISFTSTSFNYKIQDRKKGGWDIEIQPKDNTNTQTIRLTVYDNGQAYMQVNSNQRQPVSFNGTVQAITEKKKSSESK